VVVLTLPMQSDPCPMFYCKFASPLFPCCPSTSSSRTAVHEGRSDDVMFQSDKFPCHVTVVIRISCFQGMNGVRKLTCKTLPSTCCVSDVAAWVVDSQATPPEAVDLLHRSCLMNMHSALLAYDILSTPTIDAILTYPDVRRRLMSRLQICCIFTTFHRIQKEVLAANTATKLKPLSVDSRNIHFHISRTNQASQISSTCLLSWCA